MVKFTVPEDSPDPVIVTLSQINARHADETMKGSYNYAAIKFSLCKVIEKDGRKF